MRFLGSIAFIFCLSLSGAANAEIEENFEQCIESLDAASSEDPGQDDIGQASCYARAVCSWGYVSCYATGQGCTWRAVNYRGVSCTGYVNGYWQTVSYGC